MRALKLVVFFAILAALVAFDLHFSLNCTKDYPCWWGVLR